MSNDLKSAASVSRRRLIHLAGRAIAASAPLMLSESMEGQEAGTSSASAGKDLRIADLEFTELSGHYEAQAGVNGQFQVNPLDIYDDLRREPYKDTPGKMQQRAIKEIYLRIRTNGGAYGIYGPIDSRSSHDRVSGSPLLCT